MRARDVLLISLIVALPRSALAAWPVAFQGTLARGDALVDGQQALTFRIHDALQGGVVLWEDEQQLALSGGLFVAYLDLDADPEIAGAVDAGTGLWVGVQVGNGEELDPRLPLAGTLETVVAERSRELVGCGEQQLGVPLGDRCLRFVTEPELAEAIAAHAASPGAHHARYTSAEALAAVDADIDHWTGAHHPRDLVHAGDLAAVATSGLADDLGGGTLPYEALPGDVVLSSDLAPVATSNQYGDLDGRPDLQALLGRVAVLEQALTALQARQLGRLPCPDDGSVCHVYVDHFQGNDANPGSQGLPKYTLQSALDLLPHALDRSVTIELADGAYTPASLQNLTTARGAQLVVQRTSANVDQVSLECPACAPGSCGSALTVADAGTLQVRGVLFRGCDHALTAERSKVSLIDANVLSTHQDAIDVQERSSLALSGCLVHHAGTRGIHVEDQSLLSLVNTTVEQSGDSGIVLSGGAVLHCSAGNKVLANGGRSVTLDRSADFECSGTNLEARDNTGGDEISRSLDQACVISANPCTSANFPRDGGRLYLATGHQYADRGSFMEVELRSSTGAAVSRVVYNQTTDQCAEPYCSNKDYTVYLCCK